MVVMQRRNGRRYLRFVNKLKKIQKFSFKPEINQILKNKQTDSPQDKTYRDIETLKDLFYDITMYYVKIFRVD